jgi:hypothetical protein
MGWENTEWAARQIMSLAERLQGLEADSAVSVPGATVICIILPALVGLADI